MTLIGSRQLLQTLAQSLIGSPGTPDEGIRRGLGLPFRDCARSCNNCDSRRLKLCAIHVTEKAIFERFYLVLGLVPFGPSINCSYAPTTLTVPTKTISGFPCKLSGPSFFFQHDSPSNLAESRYPLYTQRFVGPNLCCPLTAVRGNIARKSRNSQRVSYGGVCAYTIDSGPK